VHRDILSKYFRANNHVLYKVFGHTAAYDQQTGIGRIHFYFGQFPEIFDAVYRNMLFRFFGLMLDEAETGAGIGKSRTKNRHSIFIGDLNQRIFLLRIRNEVPAHFFYEFAGGINTRGEPIRNVFYLFVTVLELPFIYKRIVYAIYVCIPQNTVIYLRTALVVPEADRFEKIHINDAGPGCHDHIDHVAGNHIAIDGQASRGAGTACQRQHNRAGLIAYHAVKNHGGFSKLSGAKGHFVHGFDQSDRIETGYIDMFYWFIQKIFVRHQL
jgi:hypothetical protein